MQNLKYHAINSVAILIFSFTAAKTVNSIIEYSIIPDEKISKRYNRNRRLRSRQKPYSDYDPIIKSGMFHDAGENDPLVSSTSKTPVGSVDSLQLQGTIVGPWSIARAMIKKKGEKDPKIFALYKVNKDINNDVYGYKLVRIDTDKVIVEKDKEKKIIELYIKDTKKSGSKQSGKLMANKTISRSVLQQKMKNLDTALRGIVAGPYRRSGKIVGYRLKRVRSYNILYKFGLRSGDIIKRVNGHAVNATGKLYQMYNNLKNEKNLRIDFKRRGKLKTINFRITD